jgi:transcriptional regulator with XRE-family HTH domain
VAGRPEKEQRATHPRGQQLGALLLQRRLEAPKLSRRELAELSGVSASNIQAIEGGAVTEPGFFTVVSLAEALDLDISQATRSLTSPLVFVDLRTGSEWP